MILLQIIIGIVSLVAFSIKSYEQFDDWGLAIFYSFWKVIILIVMSYLFYQGLLQIQQIFSDDFPTLSHLMAFIFSVVVWIDVLRREKSS